MNTVYYEWGTQLERGQLAQEFICEYYEGTPNSEHVANWDFSLPEGATVELKTDFYSNPENFFFERYANLNKASSGPFTGGCFKSRKDAVFYVYYFPDVDVIYWFPCDLLATRLEIKADRLRVGVVHNKHYKTDGFLVRIEGAQYLARVDRLPESLPSEKLNKMREQLKKLCRNHNK